VKCCVVKWLSASGRGCRRTWHRCGEHVCLCVAAGHVATPFGYGSEKSRCKLPDRLLIRAIFSLSVSSAWAPIASVLYISFLCLKHHVWLSMPAADYHKFHQSQDWHGNGVKDCQHTKHVNSTTPSHAHARPKLLIVRFCTRARAASRLAIASSSSFESFFAPALNFDTPAAFGCTYTERLFSTKPKWSMWRVSLPTNSAARTGARRAGWASLPSAPLLPPPPLLPLRRRRPSGRPRCRC